MNLWDEKAKTYPKFERGGFFENKVLDFVEDFGLSLNGKKVLDVGCGSGIYTLNMALRGAKVEGLDISNMMLKKLKESAEDYKIYGVKTFCEDFENFKSDEFDIATCFMSPALYSNAAREKFIAISKIGFCLLGWKERHNNVLDEIYPMMEIPAHRHEETEKLKDLLKSKNINYNSVVMADRWEKTFKFEDAVQNQIWHLKVRGVEPNEKIIKNVVSRFANENGEINSITKVKVELVVGLKN